MFEMILLDLDFSFPVEGVTVVDLIKSYKQLERYLFDKEAKEVFRNYLHVLKKEEQLLFIERVLYYQSNNKSSSSFSCGLIAHDLFDTFVHINGVHALNVSSFIYKRYLSLGTEYEFKEWIVSLVKEVLVQMKQESFVMFLECEECSHYILTKLIDFSNKQQNQNDITVQDFLSMNELEEYTKLFVKKKIIHLSQLKQHCNNDDLKQFLKEYIGIKKIGHQLKLVRLLKQYLHC
ncbi:hypothetical protein ABK040_006827 [Willaertia magna]